MALRRAVARDEQGLRIFPTNGQRRSADGCIITFENSAGDRLTLHRTGPPRQTVTGMCDDALRRDGTFLVIAYSTPETVFSDITGARADRPARDGKTQQSSTPEAGVLTRFGRPEMLHPRLRGSIDARVLAQQRDSRRRKARGE